MTTLSASPICSLNSDIMRSAGDEQARQEQHVVSADVENGQLKRQMAETQLMDEHSSVSQLSTTEEQTRIQRPSTRQKKAKKEEDDGAEGIVRAQAKTVRNLRIAMICLIVAAAAACGYLINKISSKNETDAFLQSFDEAASKFSKGFSDTQGEYFNYAYIMSVSISSGLFVGSNYTPVFPNVSIANLDILAKGLGKRGLINNLIWSPLLNTTEDRNSWEVYAKQHVAMVSQPTYPPCHVCGDGFEIARPDAFISLINAQKKTCAELNQALLAGNTSPGQCKFMSQLVPPQCGCRKSEIQKSNNSTDDWKTGIFRLKDGVPVPDDGPPPYLPVWQITPAENSNQVVMFNQMSMPWRSDAMNSLLEFKTPVLSRTFDPTQDGVYELNNVQGFGVVASVFYPVFESLASSQLAGALVFDLSWKQFFNYILPPKSDGIVVVLENTLGQAFTYLVDDGIALFVGEGDHHDKSFDSLSVESSYADFNRLLMFSGPSPDVKAATKPDTNPSATCSYRLRIYPTNEFYSRHMTSKPAIYTVFVVAAFGVTSLVFLAYDWIVRHIQSQVLDSAKRSEAIVSSLFPALVRERIFRNRHHQIISPSGFGRWFARGGVGFDTSFLNHKARLRSYLSYPPSLDMLRDAEPIADLYPNTTVMFADIAGFTAWSSEREPSQVFKLLESLFCEFDEVARELGVFKVETMGDCYVAVTGLPEKMKDHAVVMVEFAFRCLVRIRELLSKLELILGPGTADLSIRVGLHSGPVTAGVLRGDRARFQLFGDTMNVASRLEGTSEPNQVHISKETANLLIEAGREYWIMKRQELVSVKGKGQLQTYWAKPQPLPNTGSEISFDMTQEGSESFARSLERNGSLDGTEADPWGGTNLDSSVSLRSSPSQGHERLVEWFADLLQGLLQKVVVKSSAGVRSRTSVKEILSKPAIHDGDSNQFVDEITEVIEMPGFVERISVDPNSNELDPAARSQLREYVAHIASLYRDNAFHNFEHACHVAMSANKLLKRIIAPDDVDYKAKSGNKMKRSRTVSKEIHETTFGISSDPLMQFAVVFSALIHDVDHTGLTNKQLVMEEDPLAIKYHGKCVAEQRSIQVAWDTLMEDRFVDLRRCIYQTKVEKQRFRQLLVNAVIATDIADKELSAWRKNRWNKVFHEGSNVSDADTASDRKATIVFEYIIQASDIAHTMQHWHVYQKWNKRLFDERYAAYLAGREPEDPSLGWQKGEIWFFDNYIVPLAKKLEECNVFGVSCDEFLNYALQNRHEWEMKGEDIVREMVAAQNRSKKEESSVVMCEEEYVVVTNEQAAHLRQFLEGEETNQFFIPNPIS